MMRASILITVVIVSFVTAWGVFAPKLEEKARAYHSFAKCISLSGAQLYGINTSQASFRQKKLFGNAGSDLPYIECSINFDFSNQVQACREKQINTYPTWIFADGQRREGVLSKDQLSLITGCEL